MCNLAGEMLLPEDYEAAPHQKLPDETLAQMPVKRRQVIQVMTKEIEAPPTPRPHG